MSNPMERPPIIDPEKAAKAAAQLEFPHMNAGKERGLVVKEKIGTITENEKTMLALVRRAKAEKRALSDTEAAEFWRLFEIENKE